MAIDRVLLPTRPQPDTIVALFLLRTFGQTAFPGIENARIEIRHTLADGETSESLLAAGTLAIDIGGGPFDHHNKQGTCVSSLIAEALGIEKDPSLKKLLAYAIRDDQEGKGTLSSDPIDKAFGLSGLIASLNKQFPEDPQTVVSLILPLLAAHHASSQEHYVELPAEIERKRRSGGFWQQTVKQGERPVRVAFVISDKPSMPTFLRSQRGSAADVVVQKSESTNHICIVSKQDKAIDLSSVMALIRLQEAENTNIVLEDDAAYLRKTGRIDEIPNWYFDPATNSLLNGGTHNKDVPESTILWRDLQKIVVAGLSIGTPESGARSSYYLSVPIPLSAAQDIASHLSAPKQVRVHDPKLMHVTLEYFGAKAPAEAKDLAEVLRPALAGNAPFTLTLRDSMLTSGAPEGYAHAWFLNLADTEGAAQISTLRSQALKALGLPERDKALHVTLATKRSLDSHVKDTEVTFSTPFDISIPVTEVVLMESRVEAGKRSYVPHTVFQLTN